MQFRDGLIVALLAARPLRLRNLAGLELDRTLMRRGEAWWIDIPADGDQDAPADRGALARRAGSRPRVSICGSTGRCSAAFATAGPGRSATRCGSRPTARR